VFGVVIGSSQLPPLEDKERNLCEWSDEGRMLQMCALKDVCSCKHDAARLR
jgi:hypothetical protein